MASNDTIKMEFNADDNISDVIKKINKELGTLEKSTDSVSKKTDMMSGAMKAAGGLVAAYLTKETITATIELSKLGATAQTVEKNFKQFAQTAGKNTDDMMRKMRSATLGMVDDMKLQQNAMKSMISGVSFDDMIVAMEYVTKYAAATGEDVNVKMQTVMTGLARKSAQFMDDVGIQVMGAEDVVGATIDQMREKMGQFVTSEEDVSVKTAQLAADFESLKQDVGSALVPVLNELLDTVRGLGEFISDNKEELTFSAMAAGAVGLASQLPKLITLIQGMTAAQIKANVAMLANPYVIAATALTGLTFALVDYKKNLDAIADNESELKRIEEVGNEIKRQYQIIAMYEDQIKKAKESGSDVKISFGFGMDQTMSIKEATAALEDQRKALERLKLSAGIKSPSIGGSGAKTKTTTDTGDGRDQFGKLPQDYSEALQNMLDEKVKFTNAEISESQRKYEKEKEELDKFWEEVQRVYDDQLKLKNDKIKENEAEAATIKQEAMQQGFSVMDQAMQMQRSIESMIFQNRINEINAEEDRRKEAVKNSTMSEKQKAKEFEKIDKDIQKEKQEMAMKQWRLDLFNAMSSAGLAIAKTASQNPPPAGLPWIILAGLMGAASIAAVVAAKPKFARGGVVPGNSFTGDQVNIGVNSGEIVATTSQQQRLLDVMEGKTTSSGSKNVNISIGDSPIIINGNADSSTVDAIRNENLSNRQKILEMLYAANDAGEIDRTRLNALVA